MYSFFWKKMDNYQGDLADIVRAGGGGGANSGINNPVADWQFPVEPMNFPVGIEESIDDFGDPFVNVHDPLLHELDIAGPAFFTDSNPSGLGKSLLMSVTENENVGDSLGHKALGQEMKPCHLFTRMLQISPKSKIAIPSNNSPSSSCSSPRGGIKSTGIASEMIKAANSALGCPVESSNFQLPSPRNSGLKRRKSQTKKVVCIPAPAAANSRQSGEVVPSDLWAWRKYGQKPIKGSPYPRGYYRCSSSKGCSARKQVERSRTDPNMLVITYTSEHNHPWPTQRNALAGSTRSQPTKNSSSSKTSPSPQIIKPANVKEENDNDKLSTNIIVGSSTTISKAVKEEMGEPDKPVDMEEQEFNQSFHDTYRPIQAEPNQSDDFFAELGELEADPLNLMFPQGFTEEKSDEDSLENKALDPFNLFYWSERSFAETRRGL